MDNNLNISKDENNDLNQELNETITNELNEEINIIKNEKIEQNENIKDGEIKNEDSKKSNLVIKTLAVLSIVFMLGVIAIYGYASYLTKKEGSVSAKLANIICEISIQPNTSENIIHPYCTVNITNYKTIDGVEKTSETGISFKVEVQPKGNFELPEYYWQDSNGVKVAENEKLEGTFKPGEKQNKQYTIVFINSGEAEVSELVNFSLVAVQSK